MAAMMTVGLPRRLRLQNLRQLSTFAEMFRNSLDSAPLTRGDVVQGHVVGRTQPKSSTSRFYFVDFGLKTEVVFTGKEITGSSAIGTAISMPLEALEDDFNEPVFDQDRRSDVPVLQAERYSLLTKMAVNDTRILHGRFANFKPFGAGVKVLGMDAFVPRHHVVALDRPVVGSFAPFYVLSVKTDKRTSGEPGLDVNPVLSSYGGYLFPLANLVGLDSAWQKSGGGSSAERFAYLRLLTRLLVQKNAAVRRIMPKNTGDRRQPHYEQRRRRKQFKDPEKQLGDAAWLKDLPRGDWASTNTNKQAASSNIWQRLEPRMRVNSGSSRGRSRPGGRSGGMQRRRESGRNSVAKDPTGTS